MLNYLATPYTKYPSGIDAAYREACSVAERARRVGHRVFCPIETFHHLAVQTEVDPKDWQFWMACCAPWLPRCDRLLVAMIDGWEQSVGIEHERREFRRLGKPELLIHPFTLRPL